DRQRLAHGQWRSRELAVSRGRLRPVSHGDHRPHRWPHIHTPNRLRRGRRRLARLRLPRVRRRQRGAGAAGGSLRHGPGRVSVGTEQAPGTHRHAHDVSVREPETGRVPRLGAQLSHAAYVNPVPINIHTPGYVERLYDITFTAHGPTVVLAWGGHIASVLDWGAGRTFISAASGSSFHMRLRQLAHNGHVVTAGNRELSLSASALAPTPSPFTTHVSRSPVDVGTTVIDTATLTGRPGNPVAGTVTFFVCFGTTGRPNCTAGGREVGSRAV